MNIEKVDWTHDRPGGNHCPECKHGLGSAAWCQWCGWLRPDDDKPVEVMDDLIKRLKNSDALMDPVHGLLIEATAALEALEKELDEAQNYGVSKAAVEQLEAKDAEIKRLEVKLEVIPENERGRAWFGNEGLDCRTGRLVAAKCL